MIHTTRRACGIRTNWVAARLHHGSRLACSKRFRAELTNPRPVSAPNTLSVQLIQLALHGLVDFLHPLVVEPIGSRLAEHVLADVEIQTPLPAHDPTQVFENSRPLKDERLLRLPRIHHAYVGHGSDLIFMRISRYLAYTWHFSLNF